MDELIFSVGRSVTGSRFSRRSDDLSTTWEVIADLDIVIVRVLLLIADMRDRIDRLRRVPDAGYSTEATVVTAVLAAAAIAIVGSCALRPEPLPVGFLVHPPPQNLCESSTLD